MFRSLQVSDFLIQKDRLFAQITLSDDELELYCQVFSRLTIEVPVSDLVIYLQAPADVLLKRVYERGIAYEKMIKEAYLKRVIDTYVDFFTTTKIPLINREYRRF